MMYMNNNIDLPHMIYQEHKGNDDLIIEKLEEIGYTLSLVDHHDDELSNNFLYYCACI